jgi:hypothetical protein
MTSTATTSAIPSQYVKSTRKRGSATPMLIGGPCQTYGSRNAAQLSAVKTAQKIATGNTEGINIMSATDRGKLELYKKNTTLKYILTSPNGQQTIMTSLNAREDVEKIRVDYKLQHHDILRRVRM